MCHKGVDEKFLIGAKALLLKVPDATLLHGIGMCRYFDRRLLILEPRTCSTPLLAPSHHDEISGGVSSLHCGTPSRESMDRYSGGLRFDRACCATTCTGDCEHFDESARRWWSCMALKYPVTSQYASCHEARGGNPHSAPHPQKQVLCMSLF